MRHRLFHAVVLAALPGCASTTPPITPDTRDNNVDATAETSEPARDSTTTTDVAADSRADSTTVIDDGAISDTCYCKPGCLPCIK